MLSYPKLVRLLVAAVLASPTVHVRSTQTLPLALNQGVARVPGGWVLSGTNSSQPRSDVLVRTDDRLRPVVTRRPAIPDEWRARGYTHVGDIDVVGGIVYAPFEQPNYDLGHQAMARYDSRTLQFLDAVEVPQHEDSFVSVDPATMVAITMDHFDGDSLLRYQVDAGWRPLPPLPMSTTLHSTQGASVSGKVLWISTSDARNRLFRVELTTGQAAPAGTLGPDGEGEGVDASRLRSGLVHAIVNHPTAGKALFEHLDASRRSRGLTWVQWTGLGLLGAAVVLPVVAVVTRRRRRT